MSTDVRGAIRQTIVIPLSEERLRLLTRSFLQIGAPFGERVDGRGAADKKQAQLFAEAGDQAHEQ